MYSQFGLLLTRDCMANHSAPYLEKQLFGVWPTERHEKKLLNNWIAVEMMVEYTGNAVDHVWP